MLFFADVRRFVQLFVGWNDPILYQTHGTRFVSLLFHGSIDAPTNFSGVESVVDIYALYAPRLAGVWWLTRRKRRVSLQHLSAGGCVTAATASVVLDAVVERPTPRNMGHALGQKHESAPEFESKVSLLNNAP